MKYDPLKTPDPDAWLALDELARIALVEEYHRKARVKLPNAHMHAIMHSVVENQFAEGLAVVSETLNRLMQEGLDRHEAVHAISSVLIEFIQEMLQAGKHYKEVEERYFQALRSLTRESWFKMYE